MTDLSVQSSESHRQDEPRKCPHCGKRIMWHDFGGLATLAWHYPDSIITQAVVTLGGEEVDDHPLSKSEQKCGKCGHTLIETDFH
jgi:ribosomal protein S27AE